MKSEPKFYCKRCGKERKSKRILLDLCGECMDHVEKVVLPKEIEMAKKK